MVGRRKPLVLTSTQTLIKSLLTSPDLPPLSDDHDVSTSTSFQLLPPGILRLSVSRSPKLASLDHSALVGLSTSLLKRLRITSGSLVLVKNMETNIERIAHAIVVDPPDRSENTELSAPQSSHAMLPLPCCNFPENGHSLDREVAYISPMLAFNIDLHTFCLKSLVHRGEAALASYFGDGVEGGDGVRGGGVGGSVIGVRPHLELPRYASHLRASFVKIPECGSLDTLRGNSAVEHEDRQEMIDLALHSYFEVDRYLARGDVFSVCIKWNCKSMVCIPCDQSLENGVDDTIYFKVVAMEPLDETILRVNRSQTALVLGGSVSSAVPPDLLIAEHRGFAPLQGDTVKILASILTPPLCPSALSSKFRVSVLLYGLAGCGKRTVVRYVARRLGLHVVEYSCHNLTTSSDKKMSVALAQTLNAAQRYSPAILLLRHFDVFWNLQEGSPNDQVGITSEVASLIREFTEPISDYGNIDSERKQNGQFGSGKIGRHQVLLIAFADSSEGLPPTIRRCFSHEISMGPLTEKQRVEMVSQSLQKASELLSNPNTKDLIEDLVAQTSGFMPRDICALVADAGANLIPKGNAQIDTVKSEESDASLTVASEDSKSSEVASPIMGKESLTKALERSKKRNASALGTPKVPNVKWEDVGGLEDVKKSILDTVQLPLLHKDLFSSGLRKRSGVLLYGPPGTGKTLLAKAVATECSLNFLSVKGPELINMYIGESEKNIRDIFQKARSARPCVIFFDELDSLAPARGASGDSGGVMDRVVSQMLAEIDGLNDSTQDLFIIGASNRPDLIDPALLRPGRFDKLLYVGVVSDPSYRERVLKALTRKFKLHEDVSLYSIAKKCPPTFTGADMYALCADAWFSAAKRKVMGSGSDPSSIDDHPDSVIVKYDDFVKVLRELSPSLSTAELRKYELLRDQFEGSSK
ncbi:peroxisome biogenesis protein 6 [Argentina anserina]|uniref:peroxisome biogenesis protein 6 n=1 Tax=Argentina anserina TaxID=57926 RepID=UPI0021766DC6|nr:peroxisome biogenesis protein 6 [Potentilla anserina]